MRKGTLAYSVILLVILTSLVAFSPAGATTVTGTTIFDPRTFVLGVSDPTVVKAIIRFPSDAAETVKDINASTVLLEGSLSPDTTYHIPGALVAEFDGTGVVNILWGKITHMGSLAPPWKIYITVTGNLKDTAGGTPFSCTGFIKLKPTHSPPPP